MATGKRYYWIKLKDSFFADDGPVDFLMSQEGGANYVVLYEMLCLKTINTGGKLSNQIGEVLIPYDVEKIRRTCKYFSADTVRIALKLYSSLGLVYESRNGTLAITDFKNMVGSETSWKDQKRAQRAKKLPPLKECKRLNAEMLLLPSGKTQFVDEKRYGGNGMLAFDLAGGRCEMCGSCEELVIHHANEMSNESKDLYVLCKSCHGRAHAARTPSDWLHHTWIGKTSLPQEGGQKGGQGGGHVHPNAGSSSKESEKTEYERPFGQLGGQPGGQEGGHVHPDVHPRDKEIRDKEIKSLESRDIDLKNNTGGRNKSVSQTSMRAGAREDGQTDSELQGILDNCCLELFEPSLRTVFTDAIERLYYTDGLKIGNALLPQDRVRSRLHLLNELMLQDVQRKMETNTTPIKNPTAYIMTVIYTTITEYESSVLVAPELHDTNGEE